MRGSAHKWILLIFCYLLLCLRPLQQTNIPNHFGRKQSINYIQIILKAHSLFKSPFLFTYSHNCCKLHGLGLQLLLCVDLCDVLIDYLVEVLFGFKCIEALSKKLNQIIVFIFGLQLDYNIWRINILFHLIL